MAGEMLGPILVSVHNIRHFQRLLLDIRTAIERIKAIFSFETPAGPAEMVDDIGSGTSQIAADHRTDTGSDRLQNSAAGDRNFRSGGHGSTGRDAALESLTSLCHALLSANEFLYVD